MLVTLKLSYETRRLLRLIAAVTDEEMQEVAHRVIKAEWERIQEEQQHGLSKTELHADTKRAAR